MKRATSAAMKPRAPASSSGAVRFSAIHSDVFLPMPPIIKKRFSTAKSISIPSMKLAVIGLFSAIGVSTAMPQSLTASSIDTGTTALNRETPAALGYGMPAEWEPHEATWIAWPHERTDWPGKFAAIPWVFAEIVRRLHHSENVRILVNSRAEEKLALRYLERS